jgi:hypothetical protein
MPYRLSLRDRQRFARNKRDRYHRDPEYRLQRINETRLRNGLCPAASLDEVQLRSAPCSG